MIVQWKLRRGTTEEWTAANPVLAEGEPGFDLDTRTLKVGDGHTPWLGLGSQSYDSATLDAMLDTVNASASQAQAAAGAANQAVLDAQSIASDFSSAADTTVAGLINTPTSQVSTALTSFNANTASATTIRASQHNAGTDDATAYLNGLITSVNAYTRGGAVLLDGVYRLDGALIAKSNVTLQFVNTNSWLVHNYHDTTGAVGTAMIRNSSFATKVNKFAIIGPGRIGSDTAATHKGSVVAIYGDDLLLRDFTIDGWSGGRAVTGVGDRWRLASLRIVNSTGLVGDTGIRFMGGNDFKATRCHVESGDDSLQLAPGGTGAVANPTLYGQTIRRASFSDCTGFSATGRFMAVALQNRDTPTMTASILDSAFIDCNSTGGSRMALGVENFNSTGDIDGVDFIACAAAAGTGQAATAESIIARHPETLATVGKVRRVNLQGFRLRGPRKTSLALRGGVEYVTLRDCSFEAPVGTTVPTVSTTNASATLTVPAQTDVGEGTFNPGPFSDVDVSASITGTGIPAGATITAVSDDGRTITISAAATATGNITATISGTSTLDLSASVHTRMVGGSVQGGGLGNTIQAGAADRTFANGASSASGTFDLIIDGTYVYDTPNNLYGINLQRAVGSDITETTVVGKAAETTAGGIRVNTLSSVVNLVRNKLTGIATTTKRITDLATATFRQQNDGADAATVNPTAGDVLWARKAADESRLNATLADDTTLLAPVAASTSYEIEGYLIYDASTTGDLAVKFNVPTGATLSVTYVGAPTTTTTNASTVNLAVEANVTRTLGGAGTGVQMAVYIRGMLDVSTTAGNLQLQWAQAVTDAAVATVLRARSFLHLTRVGATAGGGGSTGTDTEAVQDIVAAMIVDGSNISHAYDDTAGTLTISSTAAAGGSGVAFSPAFIHVVSADLAQSVKDAAVAGGGYVCDGTADQVEINAALDRAATWSSRDAASGTAVGEQRGKVVLSGGKFNISAPIAMRTGTQLEGAGYLTELRAVGNTGSAIIKLATNDAHLTEVSHLWLNGNSTAGGSCDGVNYDMTGSTNTAGIPPTNPDSYNFVHHLFINQFTGTAGTARNGLKMWAGTTANNRGNMIHHIQMRNCNGNGIELSASSDTTISDCHVGTITGTGFKINTGNCHISNCTAFYCDVYGLWATSGRGSLTGFTSQDNATGIFLDAAPWTCSGLVVDTSRDNGLVVSSPDCVIDGASIFIRVGGRYGNQTTGLLIDAAHQGTMVMGRVTPAPTPTTITNMVSAPAGVGSGSFVRVSTGTTLYSVGT